MAHGMLLIRVFTRAQLLVDGHRKDEKYPITTMKTFIAMGLKPQGPEKEEKKKKKKEEKKKDLKKKQPPLQKVKSKPSEELRKKKKQERSLSPVSEERRFSKRRLLRLVKETSSSSSVEDEMSAIAAKLMNVVAPTKSIQRPSRARERGIMIREQSPQEEQQK